MKVYAYVALALIAVGAVGGIYKVWTDRDAALVEAGVQACVQEVNKAEYESVKEQLGQALANVQAEQERRAALEQQVSSIREASRQSHEQIAAEMKTIRCKIPKKVMDAVNAPLKVTLPTSTAPPVTTGAVNGK